MEIINYTCTELFLIELASLILNPASSTSFLLLVLITISRSLHPHQWGATASHKTRRHLPVLPLPCIPCTSHFPLTLLKRKSAATNQDSRPHYPDQDFHVHTNSTCMKSLSGDMLFGHVATPLWPSVGVKPNTWKSWRLGVFRDSRMFRARQQGSKHLALGCSWCHWKGLET